MENNLRVLLCGVFILFSCEYAAGAKKKKELETIVEVCEEIEMSDKLHALKLLVIFLCDRSGAYSCNFEFEFYLSSKKEKKILSLGSLKLVLFEGKFTKSVAITCQRGFCYAVGKIKSLISF